MIPVAAGIVFLLATIGGSVAKPLDEAGRRVKTPFLYLLEGDHERPRRLMDLQPMDVIGATEEDGAGSVQMAGYIFYLRRPCLAIPGDMFHVTTPQNERQEGPGMIVMTIIVADQDLMHLQRKPAAFEKIPADQVRLAVLPADHAFFKEFHTIERFFGF